MTAVKLSPETPFTSGPAADGAGSDELGLAHSRRPRRRSAPPNRPFRIIDLDNLTMTTYTFFGTQPS
jgi:hypothetical protein